MIRQLIAGRTLAFLSAVFGVLTPRTSKRSRADAKAREILRELNLRGRSRVNRAATSILDDLENATIAMEVRLEGGRVARDEELAGVQRAREVSGLAQNDLNPLLSDEVRRRYQAVLRRLEGTSRGFRPERGPFVTEYDRILDREVGITFRPDIDEWVEGLISSLAREGANLRRQGR